LVRDGVLNEYEPRFSLLEFLAPDAWIPRVAPDLQKAPPR
jgi:hypothetical protein